MTQAELNDVLRKHKLWLDGKEGGERANMRNANLRNANMWNANMRNANLRNANMWNENLRGADMRGADMRDADLRGADMRDADLRDADLRGADLRSADLRGADLRGANMPDADLRSADLRGADIDYSAWPLWCGSLKAHVDDRIAIQLLYHTLSVVQYSPYVSEELKRALLTEPVVDIANQFHRVDECGKLETYKEEE